MSGSSRPEPLSHVYNMACEVIEKDFARDPLTRPAPAFYAVDEDLNSYVFVTPWTNDVEKMASFQVVKNMIAEKNCVAMAFICETWIAKIDPKDPDFERLRNVQPRLHPNRIDALIVNCEHKDGRTMSRTYQVHGAEGGPRTLEHLKENDASSKDGSGFTGRMTGFFK